MPKLLTLPLLGCLLTVGLTVGCGNLERLDKAGRDPLKIRRINKKLDDIVFPEFTAPGIPLPELVKTILEPETRKYDLAESDPAKKGLNYIINNVAFDCASRIAPVAAPPLLVPKGDSFLIACAFPSDKPDLETAIIKLESTLRGLTLRQVLDVICKTAEVKMPDGRPAGLKFVVEEYAISFYPIFPRPAVR